MLWSIEIPCGLGNKFRFFCRKLIIIHNHTLKHAKMQHMQKRDPNSKKPTAFSAR